MRKGIDVSDCQGVINWPKVKAAGVEFVILRTTRRSGNPDKYLPTNIKGCVECGIPVDFYKYMYAMTVSDAQKEAKRVVEVLKRYGVMPSKDVIIWADVEDKSQFSLSTKELTQIVDAFKEVVVNSGYAFGLYMGKYAYEHSEIDVKQFDDHIWIARYYKGDTTMKISENPNEAYKPKEAAGKLLGWQYTSKGIVEGITGYVDLNVAYYDVREIEVENEYYQTPEFTLIDSLNKIRVDSSFNNRKLIAAKNGMPDYTGTREQNIKLLNMLNDGILRKQ